MAQIPIVRAAGGALWREVTGGIELALVHRPRYDDWSFPKGKSKPAEQLLLTGLREVHEETGHIVRVGPSLGQYSYPVSTANGRPARKTVRYWAMQAIGGEFVPSDEVDQLRWTSPAGAAERVSSPVDRRLLHTLRRARLTASALLIVGSASGRRRNAGSADADLDARGRGRADALVPLLQGIGVRRLLCAPSPGCAATLLPYAEPAELIPSIEPELHADRLIELLDDGVPTAVCIEETSVAVLVEAIRRRCGVAAAGEPALGPAGWCLLQLREGRLVSIDREPGR